MRSQNIIYLSIAAALSLTAAEPMKPESMSTDRGGTKSAIDAYSDGGGTYLFDEKNKAVLDSSAMNSLVFKYGEAAKENSATLKDQVKSISAEATAAEKVLADKIVTSSVAVNPPSNGTQCNDFNPNSINDIYTDGVCAGTMMSGPCDDHNDQTINDVYTDGVCAGTSVPNGSSCDDRNNNTYGETWLNGVCQGGKINGTSCSDGNTATAGETWLNGICQGGIIQNISGTGLIYDNCEGGLKNWYDAKTYCISKGMRLPILLETTYSLGSGLNGVPSCPSSNGAYSWTSTKNSTNSSNYRIWLGSNYSQTSPAGLMYVRCVK